MTTITIAYEVSNEKVQSIKSLVEKEQIHNANFNGEQFVIERGDFTCIDKDDAEYVKLFRKIQDIVNGYSYDD